MQGRLAHSAGKGIGGGELRARRDTTRKEMPGVEGQEDAEMGSLTDSPTARFPEIL